MGGHQPYHYLFYKILLRRLWKNMNQKDHLRHIPHIDISRKKLMIGAIAAKQILPNREKMMI